MLFAFTILATLPKVSSAQCPDATGPAPDPATCPWGTSSHIFTLGSCTFTIKYCIRICGGTFQIWVYEIDPTSGCSSAFDNQQLIDTAKSLALDLELHNNYPNVVECGTPPCSGATTTSTSTYIPQCWIYNQDQYGNVYLAGCSAGGCYCEKDCEVCKSGTAPNITINYCSCIVTSHGITYPPGICDCDGPAPTPPSTWPLGLACYSIICH